MMEEDAETTLLHHANKQFFTGVELASQKQVEKAIREFDKSIALYNLLSAKCSDDLKEWCSIAIDEATTQKLHLEWNVLEEMPTEGNPEAKKPNVEEAGGIFRVVCSLELVSCFLLSRDQPEELVTDGSPEPIRLCISEEEIRTESAKEGAKGEFSAFLQLTPSLPYPLGPDVPCLRVQPGYFVFMLPDQKYYGLVFPEGYPEDALTTFENELAKYCVLCATDDDGEIWTMTPKEDAVARTDMVQVAQVKPLKPTTDETAPSGALHFVANGITTGASYVTWGIRSTSEYLRSGIERTGSTISEQVYRPEAKNEIPAPLTASVGFVKNVTPGVVYISSGAASALASLAGYIGSAVGTLLPTNTGQGAAGGRFGFRAVGVASVKAAWDVWSELAGVGQNLIDGTQKASVQVVNARYGENAGKFTSDLIGIGSDLYKVNKNISSFGIKSLAKGSIKAAGTAVVKSHIEAKKQTEMKLLSSPPKDIKALTHAPPAPKSISNAKLIAMPSSPPKTNVIIESPAPTSQPHETPVPPTTIPHASNFHDTETN